LFSRESICEKIVKVKMKKIHIQTWACWAYLLSRGPSEHVLEQVEAQILISQEHGREDVSKKNTPLSYGSGFPGRKPHLSTPGLLAAAESHEGRTGREGDGGEGNLQERPVTVAAPLPSPSTSKSKIR
jgi:hypothetical protein